MLEEGQVYNSQLWEYSLLRLNQLEYFDPLKVDQDSEAHQDAEAGTVDLLLKVKEKGKNSIGLNGGVSGLSGAFLGVNYQTNNFLGLGETLSLQGNLGNVSRTLPVRLLRSPTFATARSIVGFQIFNNKQDFNAAKNYQATTGAVGQPDRRAAVADAELQPVLHGHELLGQLSAQAARLPARRRHLFAEQVHDHRLQHRLADLLPDHRFPVRHSGIERAGRHRQQLSLVQLHLQHHQQSRCARAPARNITAVFQVSGIWGNVRYISPFVAYKSFRLDALLHAHGKRAQRAGVARAVGLCAGLRRRRGSAQQPLLHRRRGRSARLRRPRRHALRLRAQSRHSSVDQSGRQLRSARSHQPAVEPVHPGADSGLRHCLHRRRHQPHHQCRVPHSHRRPGHLLVLRRLRHRRCR